MEEKRKYLEYFDGAFDSTVAEKVKPENKPYVAYSKIDGVAYTVIPGPVIYDPYVTFTAEEEGYSSIGLSKLSTKQTLEYSTDTTTWNTFDTTTNISLNKGDKVYVRGVLSADNTDSDYTNFYIMYGKISASGNCNALWNYKDLNAPLKKYCGYSMFGGCISLTTAPELPATELTNNCYSSMFSGCTSLTTAPELPATELTNNCYSSMFQGCHNLTTAPELPATKLANGCYYYTFRNCTSLTTAPELPAMELYDNCYKGMFGNCTSLTTAPELPATKLDLYCYYSMFSGCTSLNYIKCLATNISAYNCTGNWVSNVSSTGTFIKHPGMNSWSTGTSGIPSGWEVVDAEI